MRYIITIGSEYFYKRYYGSKKEHYPIFCENLEKAKRWKGISKAEKMCKELNTEWAYWTNGTARVKEIDDDVENTESNKEHSYLVHVVQPLNLSTVVSARSAEEARKKVRASIREGLTGYESATDSYLQISENARIASVKAITDDDIKEVKDE